MNIATWLKLSVIPFLCIALPLQAEDAATPPAGEATVLIDATHNNGSFEKGLQSWSNYAHQCKITDKGVRSDAPVPDGKNYAFITVTGNDVSRLDGRFESQLSNIKPENGNSFHFSAMIRSRSLDQYSIALVTLILQQIDPVKDDSGKTTYKRSMSGVLNSKVIKLTSTDWTPIDLEFTYDKEAPFNTIGLRISMIHDGATGALIEGECYLDNVMLTQQKAEVKKKSLSQSVSDEPATVDLPQPPIPIAFTLPKAGYVTLVLEDAQGKRVRNLIGGQFYEAGNHVFNYDGMDIGITKQHAQPGTGYQIVRSIIKPGQYTVRGLLRDKVGLSYDFTVYPNTGNPPWPTDIDFGSGGWLADHGTPRAVAFIPENYSKTSKPHLVLTCGVAEAAQAVAWVDLNGTKFAGRRRIGGHWTGATLLAVDQGKQRDEKIYLYSAMAWNSDKSAKAKEPEPEIRIMGFADGGMFNVAFVHPTLPAGKTWQDMDLGGLAVHNGILVYTDKLTGKLYLLDASNITIQKQATPIGDIALPDAGGMMFDEDGHLLILVGNQLHRYTLDVDACKLTDKQIRIASGLQAPRQITVDSKHNLYISDQGESHTVKVFSPDGSKLLRTIGTPGSPTSGKYNPLHMNNPDGIAIDTNNHLWIMEDFHTPKRVSVWTLEGKLVNAFYGPPGYGGGGMIDPTDPTRFYLSQGDGGMEFKIDLKTGQSKLDRIYWLKSETPYYAGRWHGPQTVMQSGGHRYVTSNYSGPTTGASLATIWRDDKERITPLSFVGSLNSWPYIEEQGWLANFPAYANASKDIKRNEREQYSFKSNSLVCWLDLNHDAQVQQNEVQIRDMSDETDTSNFLTTHVQPDMSILITHRNGVLQLKPQSITSDGMPRYDLADATPLITGIDHQPTSGGGQAFTDTKGMTVFTGGPMRGFRDGKLVWQYHSRWPGLHPGHASPAQPAEPGELLATTRLLGPTVTPRHSDAGEIWAINSDKGVAYLLTTDGLFVDYLGAYPRDGRQWDMPEHNRGMDLTDINMISEHFFPTINQLPNGDIYLVAGKSHSSIVKVSGLESIKRLAPMSLNMTGKDVLAIEQYIMACDKAMKAGNDAGPMTITQMKKTPIIDGKLNDWTDPQWVLIDAETFKEGDWGARYKEPAITAALAIDQSNLYIAVLSRRNNLTDNSGKDLQTLFKTGGGIDLKLATLPVENGKKRPVAVGDLRLLITQDNGKPTAACYRYIVPGTSSPIAFTSPVRTITIDRIDNVSNQIKMAISRTTRPTFTRPEKKASYEVIEIAVPLSLLDWNPKTLSQTTGDIGVLIGQAGSTVERIYWHNKAAGIIADIPSEAMISPEAWGEIHVK
jgi:hypothetical protein